jgi:hypothetical protein
MSRSWRRHIFTAVVVGLGILTALSLVLLIGAMLCRTWEAATTYATLLVGFIAADVVVWQGTLIKRQLAFSTYLELDTEWNSKEMIEARQAVHAPGSEEWDHSRLESILEFFEKLASLYKLSGDMRFVYESTLGWYASRYFLFAREHGQIKHLRDMWQDHLYGDLEDLYDFYVAREVGRGRKARRAWEKKRLATEEKFWEQERKD